VAILGAKTFQNYIAGEWVDAASGETFESTSPANGDAIGTFPRSSADDVDRAVAAAKESYEDWRLVPAPKRGEILFRFAHLLAEEKEDLAQLMSREMGKVLPEARGDVQEAIDMAYYMAGEGRRMFGQTTPSELRDKFNMSIRQPIGVVGVITPWNFPIAIPSWKTLPALVAGNTVVFKPATDTPTLGQRYVEILVEAGVPAGVVNIVHGGGGEVATRSSSTPTCRSSRSPARGKRASRSRRPVPTGSSTSTSSSAARTRSSFSTTPIWTWPSRAHLVRRSERRASAAPPRAA
jgi:aldehyde dehydrogenase (NAD+)